LVRVRFTKYLESDLHIPSRAIGIVALVLLLAACGRNTDKTPVGASAIPAAPSPNEAARGAATEISAIPDDCNQKVDASAAARILGVADARENVYLGHTTQSPDRMDVLQCGFSEATPRANAPLLKYIVYTPIADDVPTVYSTLLQHSAMQSFDTHLGAGSSGWVGPTASGRFQAYINFMTASNVFTVEVGGLPSADAAKSAALKLAASL